MRFCRCHFPSLFRYAAMFASIAFAGCANSCFVGVSNNGSGGLLVKAGDPAPTCSLSQANGTMNALAVTSPVCETCTPAARVEHVFVSLRSIQLLPGAIDDTTSLDWLELAPHLAREPRQIDLMGDSMPLMLVEGAIVPVGRYREVRLQFFVASPESAEKLPAGNACGETRWNCIVLANGHVEPLRLPGDAQELLIPWPSVEGDSLMVLPDARMDLLLSLEPHQGAYFSSKEGWRPQSVLVGRARVVRQRSFDPEDSITN
jgi:hypothetical protein